MGFSGEVTQTLLIWNSANKKNIKMVKEELTSEVTIQSNGDFIWASQQGKEKNWVNEMYCSLVTLIREYSLME